MQKLSKSKLKTIFLTFLILLLVFSQNMVVMGKSSSHSFNGVKISVDFDESQCKFEEMNFEDKIEPVNVKIIFKNNNSYPVTLNPRLIRPDYFSSDTKSINPFTLDANSTKEFIMPLSYSFQDYKDVQFYNPHTNSNETMRVGILASHESIAKGSEFVVECIDSNNQQYLELKKDVDNQEIEFATFFNLSIKNPSGETTQLRGPVKIYFQVPEGWDEEDLKTVYITSLQDEQFPQKIETVNNIKYATFCPDHFSNYGLIDELSLKDKVQDNKVREDLNKQLTTSEYATIHRKNPSHYVKTGDDTTFVLVLFIASALAFFILCLLTKKWSKTILLLTMFIYILNVSNVFVSAISTIMCNFSFNVGDFQKRETSTSSDVVTKIIDIGIELDVNYASPAISNVEVETDPYNEDSYLYLNNVPNGWNGSLEILNSENKSIGKVNIAYESLEDVNGMSKLRIITDDSINVNTAYESLKDADGTSKLLIITDNSMLLNDACKLNLIDVYGNLCDSYDVETTKWYT